MIVKLFNDKIELTPLEMKKCQNFSNGYNYSKYKDRNQNNTNTQKSQNSCGKIFEIAVCKWLQSRGQEVSQPDFSLYAVKDKSYAPDLIWDGQPLHIKSQPIESAGKFGESYTFQFADKSGKQNNGDYDKQIFDNPNSQDRIIMGLVDGNIAIIRAATRLDILHSRGLFKPAIKYPLEKKVVYYRDLEKLWMQQTKTSASL